MSSIRINPSILAADFANFERELQRISSADYVHVDVMDNHFVPNLTFGFPIVERLIAVSPKPFDMHLMIENPEKWAPAYADLGAHSVTFHYEASKNPIELAKEIKKLGARASLAIKPKTQVHEIIELVPEFDQILVMTVEPGFGGQKFMVDMIPKLQELNKLRKKLGLDIWLQVDGGISASTIALAAEAGADTFVAGSEVYKGDPMVKIDLLREAVKNTYIHE